jgi:nucleoside 2-deoxyribosyltransferase
MTYASEKVNAACKRVDQEEFSGDIVSEIIRLIKQSDAVIIDLSEGKANVMYEAGYAHALEKPVVHICSTPLDDLPFDVRNWSTIPYAKGQTTKLQDTLAKRLDAVLTANQS